MPLCSCDLSDWVCVEQLQDKSWNIIESLNDAVNVLWISSVDPKVDNVPIRILVNLFDLVVLEVNLEPFDERNTLCAFNVVQIAIINRPKPVDSFTVLCLVLLLGG
jgi:hypothetical protein